MSWFLTLSCRVTFLPRRMKSSGVKQSKKYKVVSQQHHAHKINKSKIRFIISVEQQYFVYRVNNFLNNLITTILAAEWRRHLPDRTVKVKFGPAKNIRVTTDRGQLLRTIDLRGMEWVIIFLQNDREQSLVSVRMEKQNTLN